MGDGVDQIELDTAGVEGGADCRRIRFDDSVQ